MDEKETKKEKTKKEAFLARMLKKRPDLNPEDEEGFYGALDEDYGSMENELGEYKSNSDKLLDVFNKDGRIAVLIQKMAKGENPLAYLIGEFGKDGLEAAMEDEETAKQLMAKNDEYLEKLAKGEQLSKDREENLKVSLDAFDEVQKELGIDDETADKFFDDFFDIINDAIANKITKETWSLFLKGLTYDNSIESAKVESEIRGRNAKIEAMKKKKVPADIPPSLGGQGTAKRARAIKLGGFLDKERKSVFDK